MLTLFVLFVAFLSWSVPSLISKLDQSDSDAVTRGGEANLTTAAPSWPTGQKVAVYVAFFLVNFVIVMGANIKYVYVVIYESTADNTIAKIALSASCCGTISLLYWTRRTTSHPLPRKTPMIA
jgi:hypothetical protein